MVKRVIIVHGWGGSPHSDWYSWLKRELENRRFNVIMPQMPNTLSPTIKEWVGKLNSVVKNPDKDTYFIGHSIGCQAIMRYLEQLPEDVKIGGAIFVAGWFNLTENTWDVNYTKEVAEPWINTPINFNKIKEHTLKFFNFQSDNDLYVDISNNQIFYDNLESKIFILHNKGHLSEEDGVRAFPDLLNLVIQISK